MRMRVLTALLILVALTGAWLLCDSFRVVNIQTTTHTAHHTYHQQNALALPPNTAIALPLLVLFGILLLAAACCTHTHEVLHAARNARLLRARDVINAFYNFLVHYFRTGILNPKIYLPLA